MSAQMCPRMARIVPSRVQAISSSQSTSREWLVAIEMLAAVLDPFHRPADQARRERNQEIFRIELALDAEAAADIDLDHVDVGLGDAEHRRERCGG